MYSTTVYLYQQLTRVLLIDTSGGYFTARYDPVYAKQLTINKGVDNVLLFEFINQDQKPVNITGSTFLFRVINQAGDELLVEKPMETLSAALGRVKVVLDTNDTIDVMAQPASYSIQRTSGNYVQAVYTDANSQARADCNIVDSSHMPTNESSLTTVKFDLVGYTGTVKVQAAQNYESVWVDVSESREYIGATVSDYFNVVGFHPILRLALNNSIGYGASGNVQVTDGVVTGISITNAGYNYAGPPHIQILGDGAGAEATCTISNAGVIAGVTIVSGGSGYVPLQFQGSIAATAIFTNGRIENVQYR